MVYSEGRNINRWLVRHGHVWEYDRYSDDWMLTGLEWLAWRTGRGLWAADYPMLPWEWRHEANSSGGGQFSSSSGGDRDRPDLSSQRAAQRFYEAHQPDDPHRLYADGDGRACESLP